MEYNNNQEQELKSLHKTSYLEKQNFGQHEEQTDKDKKEILSLSAKNISYQNKYSLKEISPTIFEEKIKKQSSKKVPVIIDEEKNKVNVNKDDYLQVRKIKKVSENDFELLCNELIGNDDLNLLYKDIISENYLPLNELDFGANVGCIMHFAFLVESLFNNNIITIDEMNERYELLKKYIYNYRPIKGDGNCFYRAIIFRYFEILILNKEIELLKNIIYEMNESFNSNEIRSRIRIKFNFKLNCRLVLHILIIILDLLEEGKINEAHYFYVKSIVLKDSFDYGLIIYFRYIFYLYIKQNENKIYLENFPIKIGNLLPSNYETEQGMFLFNKFYYLYLLSMFTDAEKIIIHLTPFVLGINLDVIIFNDNEDKTIKNMIFAGESDYNLNNNKLFVLNINGHYELLYTEDDNNKNKDIFNNYINDYYSNISIQKNENKVQLNEKNNKIQEESKEEENNNYENNIVYESSKIPPNPKNNDRELKEDNINNDEDGLKDINDLNENNLKHKVQIKIINRTTKKPKKSFSIEDEKNDNININSEKSKYSERKDIKYQNLIHNKNNEENKLVENDACKSINIEKLNLIDKLNEESDNKEEEKEEEKNDVNNSLTNDKEKNETKLSNIIINQDKKENIKELSDAEMKECKICSKNYINENKNDLFKNICKDCLKENIINCLKSSYFAYIETLIAEKKFDLAYKTYFNDFLETEISIFDNNISIRNALQMFDIKNKSNLEMHSFMQEIKQNFCIFCLGDLNKSRFEIPCKCNFCSIDHIKKYFHVKNTIRNKSNYVCICSHEYTNEDIYNIGIFFLQNKLYSLKEDAIDYLNHNYLEKQCCFCSIDIDVETRRRIKIKDFEDEIILGDTNKLKHHLCVNCYIQYKNNVEIFSCFICNKSHMIINI